MIVVLILAWGSTFASVKIGLENSPPLLFGGMRSVIGGLLVAVVALALRRQPGVRANLGAYAAITLLNVIGFFGLQNLAIDALPSGLAAVLIYLQPILTGVLAGPLLGEEVGPTTFLGLGLGFAGIVAVGAGAIEGSVTPVGIATAVAAAVAWSLGTIALKRARVDRWWGVAIPFTVGGLVLSATGALVDGVDVTWTGGFVAALAWSSVVGTALSWALWFTLVGAGEAARTAAVIFFVPIVSLVIGVLFLGEPLSVTLVVGAVLVVLGVWLVNRPRPTAVADGE